MSKGLKAVIIVSSVLILLFLCAFGIEIWLKRKIVHELQEQTVTIAGNQLRIRSGNVSVSVLQRSVTIREITLESLEENPSHSGYTISSLRGAIERLSVNGIKYRKVDGKPAVSASLISIQSPRAIVESRSSSNRESDSQNNSLNSMVGEKLHSVTVDRISVTDAKVQYVANNGKGTSQVDFDEADIVLDGFYMDSNKPSAEKLLFSDNVTVSANSVSYGDGGAFALEADSLSISGKNRHFSLHRASLIPQYSKNQFVQQTGQDWTEFTLNGIEGSGVDFAGFISGNVITIDSLSLRSGHLASYKNRQVYQAPKEKPMLYRTIQDLPVKIDVRTLTFEGMDLEYDELSEEGDRPGVITITNWSGTGRNITNIAKEHSRFMTINTTGTFMGGCRLHAIFRFPVSRNDDHWEVKGETGPFALDIFNPAVEPLANMKVRSGEVQSIEFGVTGNHTESHTVLTMLYTDLSIALLKKHNEEKERKFLTFLADDLVVKNDNPKGNHDVRVGEGSFTRNPERSMYNYLWKSVFEGVKKTVI